jgi:multidrug efflux pump subunit AcrA (membrane-fusion protein)
MLRPRNVFAAVAAPDRYRVVTELGEADFPRARTGKAAEVTFPGVPGLRLAGAIRVALLATGRDGRGANTYEVEIPLETGDPRLKPRMQCKVTVVVDEARDAVLVPAGAVEKRDGNAYVKCGAGAKGPFAERRVVLGCTDGERVVVKDGLREGEFVLVPGKGAK